MGSRNLSASLVEAHLDELSFLLMSRQMAHEDASLSWTDAGEYEDRIDAHLDGLRCAGDVTPSFLRKTLGSSDEDLVMAAAFALASISEIADGVPMLADALAEADDPLLPRYVVACRHGRTVQLGTHLVPLLDHPRAAVRAAVTEILGYRRDVGADRVAPLLQDADPAVRAASLSALGRLGDVSALPAMEKAALSGPEPAGEDALLALLRLGSRRALDHCRAACASPEKATPRLLLWLSIAGTRDAVQVLRSSVANPALQGAAMEALGVLGDPAAAPLLLEALGSEEESARLAAAAGLELLTGAGQPESVAGSGDQSEDDTRDTPTRGQGAATMADGWREWWNSSAGRFDPGIRYRHGMPFRLLQCVDEMRAPESSFRSRERAHLEIVIRSGRQSSFEPDGFIESQARELSAWSEWWETNSADHPEGKWLFHGKPS